MFDKHNMSYIGFLRNRNVNEAPIKPPNRKPVEPNSDLISMFEGQQCDDLQVLRGHLLRKEDKHR